MGQVHPPELQEILHERPLVSIVIVAHNEEKWVVTCIESVLRDSYPSKEVIVVDDVSTDSTGRYP